MIANSIQGLGPQRNSGLAAFGASQGAGGGGAMGCSHTLPGHARQGECWQSGAIIQVARPACIASDQELPSMFAGTEAAPHQ